MLKRFIPIAFCVAAISCGNNGVPAYRNASLDVEKRTEDLLSRMTVEEKLGQLLCPLGWPMYEKTAGDDGASHAGVSDEYRKFIREQHGGMLWATFRADPWTKKTLDNGLDPVLAAEAYNALQRYAVDSTRLGIPIILAEEAPHGHMAIGTTVFPTSIGLAATWSEETMESVGRVIAGELRAQGAHIGYGPVVDLAREPRWSRVEETYGEDVCLTSRMAASMVRGTGPKHNGWDKGVVSTLKHFVAYGIPEGGHNGNQSFVGQRDLHENFLPAFHAAVKEGALSVMTSYNSIDGIPSTANPELLRGILKGEWGFDGFVVSDLVSIDGLYSDHHIASGLEDAGILALNAGVDVDLGANCYSLLKAAVEDGRVSMKTLDEAAGRVLRLKFEFGLFDNPYVDPSEAARLVRSSENVAVARQAAREGVVLLENNGILPLRKDIKIAVIGPNADNMYNQLGDYTAPQPRENVKTVLDGIVSKAGKANVTYVKGCAVRDTKDNTVAQAARAAAAADVAVVVVGGSSARDFKTTYKETGAAIADANTVSDMEAGEGFDRASLSLLGLQEELLLAVRRTGTPMVVVYIEGRPLDKMWASANADALLTQFYPGQEGGNALADVLFGEYNPAGRLPVSVPRDAGQLPVYYNKRFPKGHDYVEMSRAPLYPFGYGLSYSTFEYSGLSVVKTGRNEVEASLTVTNTGKMDGDEVVQLYVTDMQASTVRPVKQLRGFRRVHVPKGGSVEVKMVLDDDAFSLYDRNMRKVVEPGEFRIAVGASSEDIRQECVVRLD
ncbi:MAG: glycoside hydrolase family 3 C-terminal domain-containing protein [Bacteroidales bacterium]|nr:glycoside hydrolase family 3 C-terminal domain-containing protein [Bacteroidales bacterium]